MFLHAKNAIFCENHMQELTTYQIKEIGKENNNHIMQWLIITATLNFKFTVRVYGYE